MDLCLLCVVAVVLVVGFLVLFARTADADLTLLWYDKFGNKPGVLKGQVVWITGASSGIGEYLAYQFASAGCRLVLSARRGDQLDRVKTQCLLHGHVKEADILVLPLDLMQFDTHQSLTNKVLQHFKQIDILVNNGGRSQRAEALRTSVEVDKQMMDLNFLGSVSLTKAVLPHMVERQTGHVVVNSSVAGKMSSPVSATYCATKFAVQGWFDSLRLEVTAHNIAVTTACPGPVDSHILENAFTEDPHKAFNKTVPAHFKRMSTERCAWLIAIATANKLEEVWITLPPYLIYTYMAQYMPTVWRRMGKKAAPEMLKRLKEKGVPY